MALAAGLLAGVLMFASLISTVASVDVANGSCEVIYDSNPDLAQGCSLSGYERHSIAFGLLGLLAFVMAVGAGPGASRGAAWGLVAIGTVVLAVALLSDLPVTNDTGAIGRDFEGATASAGTGLWLELLAGVLALIAGAARLLVPRTRPSGGGRSGDPRRAARQQEARATREQEARAARAHDPATDDHSPGTRPSPHAQHERPTDAARAARRAARAAKDRPAKD